MQRHNNNSATVILPAAVLAAFFLAIGCLVILVVQSLVFIGFKVKEKAFPQVTVPTVYPEQVIAAAFEDELIHSGESDRVEVEVATVIAEAPAAEVVEPLVPQKDETLIQIDQALLLLKGISRNGWHTMLKAIGEERQSRIPSNFKQMSKNKSRAQALLQLQVSASIVSRARELALQSQAH